MEDVVKCYEKLEEACYDLENENYDPEMRSIRKCPKEFKKAEYVYELRRSVKKLVDITLIYHDFVFCVDQVLRYYKFIESLKLLKFIINYFEEDDIDDVNMMYLTLCKCIRKLKKYYQTEFEKFDILI